MGHIVWSCSTFLPSTIEIFQRVVRVTERTQNLFQIEQRVLSPKERKPILYVTRHLILIYISIKYHQNVPKGIQVTGRTRSFTQTPMLTQTGSVPKAICSPRPPLVGGNINILSPLLQNGRNPVSLTRQLCLSYFCENCIT